MLHAHLTEKFPQSKINKKCKRKKSKTDLKAFMIGKESPCLNSESQDKILCFMRQVRVVSR